MAKQNEPEQLDLFKQMHPVCQSTGCKQESHFQAIRKLQALNAHLEKYSRHFDSCLSNKGNEKCTCGFEEME